MELLVFMGFVCVCLPRKFSEFMGLLEIRLVTVFMGLFLGFIYGLVWFNEFIFVFLHLMEIGFGYWIWIWGLLDIGLVAFWIWVEEHEKHFLCS